MSQTRYKLPGEIRAQCISYVRDYDRLVRLYHKRRNDVIYETPSPKKSEPIKKIPGGVSDPVYTKTVTLEEIEGYIDTKIMKAVEQAKLTIGEDWADAPRSKLAEAIWDSCMEGRNFKLHYYDLPIGKDNFYEHRRRFLWRIARLLGRV